MSATTLAEKKSFWLDIKKHVVTVVISAAIAGLAMFVGFYYNTNAKLPEVEEKINVLTTKVNEIEKQAEGPAVDGKLNSQRLDDIQRQINEVKEDVKTVKQDIKNFSDKQDKNQQQIIDILKRR